MSSDTAQRGPGSDFDPELDPVPAAADASHKARLEAALAVAKRTTEPGADPFEYDLTAGTGAGPAPTSEAQVYVSPTEAARRRQRDTLELIDKVEIAPAVDPRRAVTQPVQIPAEMEREAAAEQRSSHPPAVTPPASVGPASVERTRRRAGWMVGVGVVALIGATVVSRLGARPAEGVGPAPAPRFVKGAVTAASAVREVPSATAPPPVEEAPRTAPSVTAPAPNKPRPAARPRATADDPYSDAAAPSPPSAEAKSTAAPTVPLAPPPTTSAPPPAPPVKPPPFGGDRVLRKLIMRPNHRLAVTACFLCAVALAAPGRSYAADGRPPDALIDKAAALYDEGVATYKQAKWAQARASFLAAWALKKHWQIAASLGDCEVHLGLYRDAAEHLAYFLRTAPPERQSAQVKEAYAKARSKEGTLAISVDTPGADVVVDGEVVGKAPLADPVFVEPGHHSIEARLGAKRATDEGDIALGGERAVSMKLVEPAAAAPPPLLPTPSGSAAMPPLPAKRSPVPAIIAGGFAVGAAVVGVALLVVSSGKKDEVLTLDATIDKDHHRCAAPGPIDPRCADIEPTARDASTFHDAAVGTFVGAGILAAGALTYLLWPAPKAKKAGIDAHAAPVLGAGHGGIIIGGAF